MAKQKETPSSVDLDETAELPILQGAPPMASGAEDPLAATDAYNAPTIMRAPSAEAADSDRTVLRRDDTREQRIALREAEIGALRSDLASVTESRGQLERNLGNLTSNLRELEQMLNGKSEQLSMFEREVGNRDRRIAELESRSATLDGEFAATSAERDLLRTELQGVREDAAAAHALIQARDASSSALLKEREQQMRRVRLLEADLAQARGNAERYRELLQSMEGRRQIFESMLNERESVIIESGGTVAKLEAEMTHRVKLNSGREQELKALLTAEQDRVRQMEQAAIIQRTDQDAARTAAAESLKAAEQIQINARAELDAQKKEMDELRTQLQSVMSSLAERNALIERLETEMVSSSQVLGSIQHNLEHLGDVEPTRMLVRTQGDTGIVQLLGRRTTLGRTPDNDIRIDEDFISRHHAVLLLAGATTVVEDLNSTNGTYVNNERVNRRTIKEGDLVTLGKTEFRFVVKRATDKSS
jgi:DNA repair exonuclease SbcCD ATPase subunit